ncbi:6-bladed beta-propeller [Longimicrobium sp.]|uniref:6-bladed beta-propeller n=1 Tax=Longimicrobium sp. TaxID=2029185 RepID=UPI003B3A07C1
MIRIPFLSRACLPSILPAALLLPLAACGGDAAAAGPSVRDSAGIRIVQNDAPAWKQGQEWRVSAEPVTDIGVAEGDVHQQFARIADAQRLSDGTLLVADGQANELRAFDAQGKYLRTVGRSGGGPGEFKAVELMYLLPGDTVAVFDYMGGRLSYFAPTGAFVRGVTLQPVDGKLPPRPLGFFSDGRMLVKPLYNPNFVDSPRRTRDTVALAVYSAAGTQAASLGRVPGEESVTITGGEGGNQMMVRDQPPFGLATSFAVQGTRLLVGDPARYELVERRPDGAVARLIRRAGEREPVTQADRDAAIALRRERMDDPRFRQIQEQLIKGITFPEHKPFFTDLRMDPAGNAWVRRPADPDAETPWDVFDAEGRLLGTVTTPAGLRVTQIGADFIVGTWSDEMDVPHVRVHRLEKPRP